MNAKKVFVTALLLLGTSMLTACGLEKLEPEDYCEVLISGADGYATASLEVDYTNLALDISDIAADNGSNVRAVRAYDFADTISFEIVSEKTTDLTNGDTIEVEISYDEDKASDYGFKFTSDSFTYKINDLEEAEEIDAFEGLSLTYSGYSPKGTVSIDTSGCSELLTACIQYECDKTEDVSNGDTITVTASVREEYNSENILQAYGYVLGTNTKTFVVSGLNEGTVIDPFDGLELEYSGVSPNTYVSFNTTNCADFVRNNVSFSTTSNTYANGETAKVSISYNKEKAEENGIVFTQEEKDYVISGAPEYPLTIEGVDLSEVESQFKDTLESNLSKSTAGLYVGNTVEGQYLIPDVYTRDEYVIKSITYTPAKGIYMTAKNSSNGGNNTYCILWDIKVTAEKTAFNSYNNDSLDIGSTYTATFFGETYIKNFPVDSEGNVILDNASPNCAYYDISYKGRADSGTSIDSLAEKWRTNNIADYNVTITNLE